jgi:YfiH family protein
VSRALEFGFARDIPGFFAFTTTREAGNLGLHVGDDPARVLENRRAVAGLFSPCQAVCLQQVHGSEIVRAGSGAGWEDYGAALPGADGVVTDRPGLALVIGHADCLGMVLVDPGRRTVGMAHAGWRGALAGIAGRLVARMADEFGSRPADLWAGLSPCLGPCCLELSGVQHEAFSAAFRDASGFCGPLKDGHFMLDLWACGKAQLMQAGVAQSRIEVQALCTGHHPDSFFSHRRDQGKTGRMMTFAGFRR